MSFVPRPYQQKAHDRVLESFQNSQSSLLVMPTGTGKTKTAAWIASEFKGKGRILWMSHQRELIFQGQEALEKAFGEKPEVEMADSWASKSSFWGGANIIVSSYQTQNAGKNGGRMTRFDPNDIALIVDDESHHSVSPTRRKVLEYYKQNKNLRILGLTATPKRLDEKALGQVFDHVAFEYYILDAINDGWLVKPIQIPVYVGELDYSNIHATVGGDLNGRDLSELVEREGPVHGMTKPIIDLCGDKKTLIFTVTVAQAEMMAEILNRNKHGSAEYVHGKTPRDLRYQLFHRYKDGDFQYLVNVGICGEGWDEPGVECVVMARPTLSRAKYEQNIGRGLRPLMGVVDGPPTADERKAAIAASRKRECLILDFVGVSGQHKLIRCEDVLGGRLDDDVVQAVAKKSEKGERQALDIVSELVQAEREIARRNREKEEAARRSGIVIGAMYTVGDYIDPFNELDVTPCRVPTWHQKHMATDAQKRYLENNGLNVPEDLNFVHASQLIQKLKETPSKKQLAQLTRCGFPTNVTREQASRFMAAIVQNHWRPLRPQQKQELIAKVLGGVENAAETQATREYTYAS